MKKRLDLLMVERALAPSREKAKAYIMSGDVYVDGQKEDKAGTMFKETVKIEVRGNTLPYVSRMYGCWCIHWRIYRLYAPEWCGEGLFNRCRIWTA